MQKNYNYNFENRTDKPSIVGSSVVNLSSCKSADLNKLPKVDGKFYHTTDDNKFYFDWGGKRTELNLGESSSSSDTSAIEKKLAEIQKEIAKLDPQKIDSLETTVNNAVKKVNDATSKIDDAVASVNGKADTSYVDTKVAGVFDNLTDEQKATLKGERGDDGKTPEITTDGYWKIGDTTTSYKAILPDEGTLPTITDDGTVNNDGTDGYVTVNKIVSYIDECFSKKKVDEITYAYINGYFKDSKITTDVTVFNTYNLTDDETTLELIVGPEIQIYDDNGETSDTVGLIIDVPEGYSLSFLGLYNDLTQIYDEETPKSNPRCAEKTIGNVMYKSYIRSTESKTALNFPSQWKIIIKKD